MEGRQPSQDARASPVQLLLKTKDPFDLNLTDSRPSVGDWGLDAAGVFFLPVTWDRSYTHLCSIFTAFKEATGDRKNPKAQLEFPSSLSIEDRGDVQGTARKFGLGANSSGIGNNRFLTIYTSANQAKKAKDALNKAQKGKRLTPQLEREAMDMWRCWQAVGGEGRKFSQKEVLEMVCTGQVDPELRDVYLRWLRAGKPDRNLPTARQQGPRTAQELFDNIQWLKPESGHLGQVFYNKVHLSESRVPPGVKDSYWAPEARGSTRVLSHAEAMPTHGLTHALVCTSQVLDSYILNYFPPSVALSVVCPADSSSPPLAHRTMLQCPHHPADSNIMDSPCDCADKRQVDVIHPKNSRRLHANFCILRYEAHVRLVVTSAPFSEQGWTRQGQLGWFCDLPLSFTPEVTQQTGYWAAPRDQPLASDLEFILCQLGVPQQTVWSLLTDADFTAVSTCVRLIPCVPGRLWPRGRDISRVGLVKLAELLSQVPWPGGHDPPLVYQSPHVDCSSSLWLHSLYCSLTGQAKALFSRRDVNERENRSLRKDLLLQLLRHIQVVHPWAVDADNVPNLAACQETNMSWEGDMWNNLYNTSLGSSGNVAWNAKAVMRTCHLSADKDGPQYGWLLLGSHSMTPESWGEVVLGQRPNHDPFYRLHSWELSVLILPHLTQGQGVSKLLSPDLCRWDLPGRPEHLRRCPPGGLPVPTLLKMSRQEDKMFWHLVGQVKEIQRSGLSVLVRKVPYETQTPSRLPLDEWPGPEVGYEASLHVNVALLSGLDHLPKKGWMVDVVASLRQTNDKWQPYYLCIVGVLHTWKEEDQPGRHCNIINCVQHGPKHPQFAGLERHPHEFKVVGLDLNPKEPLLETYPDPKPPPGRDRLIGRLQRLHATTNVAPSGPGGKRDYDLQLEAVWQRYFTGLT
ncbi:uncharacterized protein LOC144882645 isoform X2 [Branchiostoma floridae x Branchiostoma japonicum]